MNIDVKQKFVSYPVEVRRIILEVRRLIFEVAEID